MILQGRDKINTRCEEVSLQEGLTIIDELDKELLNSSTPGIGLAANQIGKLSRVFILRIPAGDYTIGYNFINPLIIRKADPIIVENEGCLSFPWKKTTTLRYNEIDIIDDLNVEPRKLKGLTAVAAFHEMDHLDGIVMDDRLYSNIGRNDRCFCDSGKKFKKCCLPKVRRPEYIDVE